MNKIYRVLQFKARLLVALVLGLFALYVAGGRLLLVFLPDYKNELESYLSESLEIPLSIQSVEGLWAGFDPVIRINGLVVNEAPNSINVDAISIRLDFLKSALAQSIRFKTIEFLDTRIPIEQTDKGWSIAGISVDTTASTQTPMFDEAAVRAWLNGANISFIESTLHVQSKNGVVRDWRLPGISLNYQDDKVFASGQVVQPESLQPLLSFALNGEGVLSESPVQGEVFLEMRSSDILDPLLKHYQWQGLSLDRIDATARIWADFKGLSIAQLQGELQVNTLDWRSSNGVQNPIEKLVGSIKWSQGNSSKLLQFNNLSWQWNGLRCGGSNGRYISKEGFHEVYVDELDIACLSSLSLASGVTSAELHDRLDVSQPNGLLKNIFVQIEQNLAEQLSEKENFSTAFGLQAELDNVSLYAYESTPSAAGIDGYIEANAKGGQVVFQSERFELGFPELFLAPWSMKLAEGAVSWSIEDGADDKKDDRDDDRNSDKEIRVFSDGLRLYMPDDSLVYGDFSLLLNPEKHEDYLTLALGMQDIKFTDVTKFVPYYQVGEGVVSWLRDALTAGDVERGIFYGFGSVEGSDAKHDFTSSLEVSARQGEVLFEADWPPLDGLDAVITLQNSALIIESTSAAIHGTKLINLMASLPAQTEGTEPELVVTGEASVSGRALDYWLAESPVAAHTSVIGEQLDITESVGVKLALSVPMVADQDVSYDIETIYDDNTIKHLPSELLFQQVSGSVFVSSEKGVYSSGIATYLFEKPAQLTIESREERLTSRLDANGAYEVISHTDITLRGQTSISALLHQYDLPPIAGLSGDFDYNAFLDLSSDKTAKPELTIKSDLLGVSREWPQPFNKAPTSAERLLINTKLGDDLSLVSISLQAPWQPRVDSNVLFDKGRLTKADVLIGSLIAPPPRIPKDKGVFVHGTLPSVDVSDWIDFIVPQLEGKHSESGDIALNAVDLTIAELNAFSQTFKDTQVLIAPEQGRWGATVAGNEVKGKIGFPDEQESLDLNFERLTLTRSGEAVSEVVEVQEQDTSLKDNVDPRKAPALSFNVKKLVVDDDDFGAWRFVLSPEKEGARIRDLHGQIGDLQFSGQINWLLQDGHPNSILTMDVSGNDFESFTKHMGKPALISSSSLVASAGLVWPSHPYDMDLERLSGSIKVEMKDGFLKTPDKKTGALRLLGIFNAETLGRRLKLDFSDLYKSGISYDSFVMDATIDQGQLSFKQPLVIDGPSSKYEISGGTNLASEKLDMKMTVELPLSKNVPLAALMLGAPQVGGAVWVIDKLLGEPLSSITSAKYHLTGSWGEPSLESDSAGRTRNDSKEKY